MRKYFTASQHLREQPFGFEVSNRAEEGELRLTYFTWNDTQSDGTVKEIILGESPLSITLKSVYQHVKYMKWLSSVLGGLNARDLEFFELSANRVRDFENVDTYIGLACEKSSRLCFTFDIFNCQSLVFDSKQTLESIGKKVEELKNLAKHA